MPWWRSKQKRNNLPDKLDFTGISPPYRLHLDNPVLCGFGVDGEYDFLQRLRCPAGASVRYRRLGAIRRSAIGYLQRPDVVLSVSRGTRRRIGDEFDPLELPLDAFTYACECNEHVGELFIDMYFRGPEMPIGEDGWELVTATKSFVEETANCPYCDKLLRTHLAKQCRFCKMDWHDAGNVYRRT